MIDHYIAARQELEGPGSPFAVTTITVRGVEVKTYAAAPPNMRVVWEMTAAHGDKKYVVYEDESYTYAEIHAQGPKLAQFIVDNGVQRGD
ncbi:MAG: AMP-dependent synthetase, partial [Ilumatobacteraceae bacterium]